MAPRDAPQSILRPRSDGPMTRASRRRQRRYRARPGWRVCSRPGRGIRHRWRCAIRGNGAARWWRWAYSRGVALCTALEKAILTARQRLAQSWSPGARVQMAWEWLCRTTQASTWNGRLLRASRMASPKAEMCSVCSALSGSNRRTVNRDVLPGTRLWRQVLMPASVPGAARRGADSLKRAGGTNRDRARSLPPLLWDRPRQLPKDGVACLDPGRDGIVPVRQHHDPDFFLRYK